MGSKRAIRYGDLRVIRTFTDDKRRLRFECECACGKRCTPLKANVVSGKTRSCNTHRMTLPDADSIIGDWTVLHRDDTTAEVQCSCGTTKTVYVYSLMNGDSTSCGHRRRTGPRSRLRWMWEWMHSRCENPTDPMYKYYGGRGIFVCEEWLDPDSYIDWAIAHGFRKGAGLQIDRIDNDGPYSPENCRVGTVIDNANNKSNNRVLIAWGETKTLGQWAADSRCAVSYSALWARAKKGTWSPKEMISRPVHR